MFRIRHPAKFRPKVAKVIKPSLIFTNFFQFYQKKSHSFIKTIFALKFTITAFNKGNKVQINANYILSGTLCEASTRENRRRWRGWWVECWKSRLLHGIILLGSFDVKRATIRNVFKITIFLLHLERLYWFQFGLLKRVLSQYFSFSWAVVVRLSWKKNMSQ